MISTTVRKRSRSGWDVVSTYCGARRAPPVARIGGMNVAGCITTTRLGGSD